MEKQQCVNERELMQNVTVNPCFNVVSDIFIHARMHVHPPFPVPIAIVTCVLPAPPLNGALLTNTNPTESSVITFQCDPGFSLVGTETATCNNSGLWDPHPALLECKFIYVSCAY